jgi:hypothetical protein
MENPLRPQPLMAEVLPGFTVIFILAFAYCFAHPGTFTAAADSKNTPTIIGGGFLTLIASWIIGTFIDAVRDILEDLFDRRCPVNWRYLLVESAENIQKLENSWLAYYFLTGNMAIGLLFAAALGVVFRDVHLPISFAIAIFVAAILYAWNFWTLRKEIRGLIGYGFPHEGVYTRIKPSAVVPSGQYKSDPNAGVGVVAIKDIPKGALVFAPDDDMTIRVSADQIAELPPDLRKLYEDFGVLDKGAYICPVNFNKLTISWYLNCSENPNVEADEALRFLALRDIHVGEELFSRYSDYSE